jgi:hypothetical protein
VNIGWNDATGCRTSEQLVRESVELVEGVRVGAGCGTASSKLQGVHATALLATRTPDASRRVRHIARGEEDCRKESLDGRTRS